MSKHSSAIAREPHVNQTTINDTNINTLSEDNIEALAEIICRAGDESPAALLVLMGMFENSTDPRALAHTVKHFAFTRCGEVKRQVRNQIITKSHGHVEPQTKRSAAPRLTRFF